MNIKSGIVKSSFFDSFETSVDNKKVESLWLTEEAFQEQFLTTFQKFDKGDAIYSGIMCKQDENQEINEYVFKLYNNFLVQYKNNNENSEIIAIMHLLFVKVEYQEEQNSNDELPFLLLSRNKQFDILVTTSNASLQKWLQLLKQRCILACFSQKYQSFKIIGKGTFAKVMLCIRNSDQKEFAVKIFDKTKIKASKNVQQTILGIHNEIKLMWQLDHKNIIHLHEVYEGESHVYLVLDLLTGGELFNKLQTKDSYCEKDACALMVNLLSSLEYLHSKGIMHRDIKPENLILKNEQSETEIILADFGLSEYCSQDQLQLLFKKCGTPGYVAPEILNNQQYDTKVDVFSAGIIFYVILTGYAPFYGDEYEEILMKNKKCCICFDFKKIDVNLSVEAVDLLKQMLEPNPKQRITAKDALNHAWVQKFTNKDTVSQISKFSLHLKSQKLQNYSKMIKQTKPQKQDSNELIMNSPIITGNKNEIQSPFGDNSPHILDCSPNQQNKQQTFPGAYKGIINKIENGAKIDQKIVKKRRNDTNNQKTQPYFRQPIPPQNKKVLK